MVESAHNNQRPGKRLLVTGASGFLGWNLCRAGRENYRLYGVVNRNGCPVSGIVTLRADLTDHGAVEKLFEQVQPEAVIHAAADADPNHCQLNPEESGAINVDATSFIVRQCRRFGIPCVIISTDLVFDGISPPFREDDPVNPLCIYGEQKVCAERRALDDYPEGVVVCRMPLMYGDAPPHAGSFLQTMVAAMREGRRITLFTDEFRTPLSAADGAEGIFSALEKEARGVLHLGGPERLSRFEAGVVVAEALGIEPDIRKALRSDVVMAAPRPADVSLACDRTRAIISFSPGAMKQELGKLSVIGF